MDKIKKESIFISIAILLMGVFFIIFPRRSTDLLCYIVGAAACVWGVMRIISYFKTKKEEIVSSFGFAQGAALVVAGVVVFLRPSLIANIITMVFGIVMVVDGLLKVQYSLDLARAKTGNWIWVMVSAAVMIILGIVALINPFTTATAIMMFLGIILVIDGLVDIAVIVYISKLSK